MNKSLVLAALVAAVALAACGKKEEVPVVAPEPVTMPAPVVEPAPVTTDTTPPAMDSASAAIADAAASAAAAEAANQASAPVRQ